MKILTAVAAAALAVGAAYAGLQARRVPTLSASPATSSAGAPEAAAGRDAAGLDWAPESLAADPGAGTDSAGESPAGGLAARFRLAGIFIVGPGAASDVDVLRRAILDDLGTHEQLIAGEGQMVAGLRVIRIGDDFVRLLDSAGQTTDLRLAYLRGASAPGGLPAAVAGEDGEGPPLEVSQYGRKVQENRWVLERDAMLDYYRELAADPDRIARLYETFKPDYAEDGTIQGYEIDPLGEEEFLQAMGLRSGDRVRMVNSLRMSSQSRAEFFIKEFINERLGAVVLDLEREGQPVKQVYLFR